MNVGGLLIPNRKNGEEGNLIKLAFVIYDGLTLLDYVGAYDPVTRLNKMRGVTLYE
jgi:hypothetical protein